MNPARIVEMASAFYESCVLFAASDLGVFGKLAELGEMDAEGIASACGLDRRGACLPLPPPMPHWLATAAWNASGIFQPCSLLSVFSMPGSP